MNLRLLLLLVLAPYATVSAQVTLPRILTSHMVVQRDLPVHVWGWATSKAEVSVNFRGETRSTVVGELGRWSIYLSPGAAGGPFQMTVREIKPNSSKDTPADPNQIITLDDVLVGDVWLAGGQSNMEFELRNAETAAQDLPHTDNTQIRLLFVRKRGSDYPLDDIETKGWEVSSPESARSFSAVAWYFAREICNREKVPIGVIDSTWGGTMAEVWVRMGALGSDAALAPVFASWGKFTEEETDTKLRLKQQQLQRDEAKSQGKPEPYFPWHPVLESQGPGMLYNGMIAPVTPFPIRGVIWYQGESNSVPDRAPLYKRIFTDLIEDWRRQWGEGDFPFLFVQAANFEAGTGADWFVVRDQQLKTLALRNTAMVVTIDIGNPIDVHPTDKLDVGLRLARAARAISYGENIEYSGPLFRQATPEGNSIRVWFDHAKGLNAKDGAVTGFEVAGGDGKFFPATAKIEGGSVLATSTSVPDPVFVRYAWANNPPYSLYNGDQLPASPFTSVK